MKYRSLGRAGLQVSGIVGGNRFGPPRLDKGSSIACLWQATESGVNFIDTAQFTARALLNSVIGGSSLPIRLLEIGA